ncbi:MAG: c-type cytochrome [Gemmatimonadales bacterium]|nr:c-type cytochrome [Gemmatimonadales bacterium]
MARIGFALVVLAGCTLEQRPPHSASSSSAALGEVLRAPPDSEIPQGPMGVAIRRGRALLAHTGDSLPKHSANSLRCFSCHLGEGIQANALSLVGVYARFPQYRSRNAMVNLLEDRINDCFERSMNGTAIPRDGREMREIIAYLAFISRGVASPGVLPGVGLPELPPLTPDTARGRTLYAETCVRCHGAEGEGTPIAPPVWGPRSFNIGAGMARLRTAAGFIWKNMPNDRAVRLTEQQAVDVAAYVVSRPRPDFARKEYDWPNGDPPPDVAYPTRAARPPVPPPAKP